MCECCLYVTYQLYVCQLDLENGVHYLETTDENKCNWMMFVRPATTYAEQNLVAYQFGADICFTTIRDIEPKQELKVCIKVWLILASLFRRHLARLLI